MRGWQLRSRRLSVALTTVLLLGPTSSVARARADDGAESSFIRTAPQAKPGPPDVTQVASELDVAVADIAFELSKKLPRKSPDQVYGTRVGDVTFEGRSRVDDETESALGNELKVNPSLTAITRTQDILGIAIEETLANHLVSQGGVALTEKAKSQFVGSYWLGPNDTLILRIFWVNELGSRSLGASRAVKSSSIEQRYQRYINELRRRD